MRKRETFLTRAVRLFFFAISFLALFGGEPLHEFLHVVSGTEHHAIQSARADGSEIDEPVLCRYFENWVSLISTPALQETSVSTNFPRLIEVGKIEFFHRALPARELDLATRPRGPPGSSDARI